MRKIPMLTSCDPIEGTRKPTAAAVGFSFCFQILFSFSGYPILNETKEAIPVTKTKTLRTRFTALLASLLILFGGVTAAVAASHLSEGARHAPYSTYTKGPASF